ncbi:MAG: hypothetical protein WKF97_23870 [Chitinophagaceae bacterium]
MTLLFGGDRKRRLALVFDELMKPSFFKEIPDIAQNTIPRKKYIEIDSIIIYRTSFSEKLVESNNAIEYAFVNDSSKTDVVKYKQFEGYFQHLYLLHLITKPKNENAVIYMTVKYDADGECIGFGPSYYGYLDTYHDQIKFTTALKLIKKKDIEYQLSRINSSNSMLFIAPLIKPGLPINIQKIVYDKRHKVGLQQSRVYTVAKIFKDPTALKFYPIGAIKFFYKY